MMNVVPPTIANLISSWCRSAYGRITRGSRAIVASAKDTDSQCTELAAQVLNRAFVAGHATMVGVSKPRRETRSMPVVAMIGGGQLARMTHQAAVALGQTLRVLAENPGDPAAQVSPDVVLGSHTDYAALREVATGAAALTFDHEHVPTDLLDKLVADGVNVAPPPQALVHAQDKLVMRRKLSELGAPVPRFTAVATADDVAAFADQVGGQVVIKTIRGGYDGKGVVLAEDTAQAVAAAERYLADGVAILVEERVAMRRELSVS